MTSPNGLVCFTNCLLPLEDGSLVQKDLWVDERRGVILDAQVCSLFLILIDVLITLFCVAYFLCQKGKARQGHRSRRKHPEVYPNDRMRYIFTLNNSRIIARVFWTFRSTVPTASTSLSSREMQKLTARA